LRIQVAVFGRDQCVHRRKRHRKDAPPKAALALCELEEEKEPDKHEGRRIDFGAVIDPYFSVGRYSSNPSFSIGALFRDASKPFDVGIRADDLRLVLISELVDGEMRTKLENRLLFKSAGKRALQPKSAPEPDWPIARKCRYPSVFIPAKEMLTHAGFEKDYLQRKYPFDATLIDILNKSGVSVLRELPDESQAMIAKIEEIIGGKVVFKNNIYYIVRNGVECGFNMEAEGFKKLAVLWRLIETGTFAKGSLLFWDEPEANLNPRAVPAVADILFALKQQGVQVFLATHDYMFAKYLSVRNLRDVCIQFHARYYTEPQCPVSVESSSSFTMLSHNSIIKQSIDLYFEETRRALG